MCVLRKCGPSFPAVLAKMPLIETLIISTPEACESDFDALVINLRMISTFRLGLAKALKLAPLGHITDLRLTMSWTYDYFVLNDRLSDRICARLRYLNLSYIDTSGLGGSAQYMSRSQLHGNNDYALFSSLQEHHPNERYIDAVCDIVNRCAYLESLGLAVVSNPNVRSACETLLTSYLSV
jgi:hypothetical protein